MVAQQFSLRRALAIFVVTAGLLAVGVGSAIRYVEPTLNARYFNRGIAYLKAQDYTAARREFTKAKSPEWEAKAAAAETDPRLLDAEWRAWGIDVVVRKLDEATATQTSAKKALAEGIKLYNQGDAAYAQYAVDQALTLDPLYPEAWHYRALIYDALAEFNVAYREKAGTARAERDKLTPRYLNQ